MDTRPFERTDLLPLARFMGENAVARWPAPTSFKSSDLAWQLPGSAPRENIRLWFDNDLAAWAWFQPPGELHYDIRVDLGSDHAVFGEILAWARHRRNQFEPAWPFYLSVRNMDEWREALRNPKPHPLDALRSIVTTAHESDAVTTSVLEAAGFERLEHWQPVYLHALEGLPEADAHFTVMPVSEAEIDQRVQLHRDAWAPGSTYDRARHDRIRAMAGIYDGDLDLVARAPDGTFASYTIAWIDPITRLGAIEPFGTHPDYRGSGASQAVIYEALRQFRARGMRGARLGTAGFNHPAQRLYTGCGYEQVDVERSWRLTIG